MAHAQLKALVTPTIVLPFTSLRVPRQEHPPQTWMDTELESVSQTVFFRFWIMCERCAIGKMTLTLGALSLWTSQCGIESALTCPIQGPCTLPASCLALLCCCAGSSCWPSASKGACTLMPELDSSANSGATGRCPCALCSGVYKKTSRLGRGAFGEVAYSLPARGAVMALVGSVSKVWFATGPSAEDEVSGRYAIKCVPVTGVTAANRGVEEATQLARCRHTPASHAVLIPGTPIDRNSRHPNLLQIKRQFFHSERVRTGC